MLDDLRALTLQPPGQFDLEAVALGRHRVEVQRPQRLGPEHPETRRQVVHGGTQHHPRVGVADARDRLAQPWPVPHRAAGHPPGAEHQVGAGRGGGQHRGQLRRVVGTVRVHLHDERIAGG